jgi:hypothetical protein
MSTTPGPVTALRAAEAALVEQIDRTTAAVNAVATSSIDSALARLQAATSAAAGRLRMTATVLGASVLDLAGVVKEITAALAEDLTTSATVAEVPALPITPPIGGAAAEATGTGPRIGPVFEQPQQPQEAPQSPAAVEPAPEPSAAPIATPERSQAADEPAIVTIAANSPSEPESAEQTMARVLLGGERHRENLTTNGATKKKRGKRGRKPDGEQPDNGAS